MARGEGFYCSDPWCDGDHPLPSMICADPVCTCDSDDVPCPFHDEPPC